VNENENCLKISSSENGSSSKADGTGSRSSGVHMTPCGWASRAQCRLNTDSCTVKDAGRRTEDDWNLGKE